MSEHFEHSTIRTIGDKGNKDYIGFLACTDASHEPENTDGMAGFSRRRLKNSIKTIGNSVAFVVASSFYLFLFFCFFSAGFCKVSDFKNRQFSPMCPKRKPIRRLESNSYNECDKIRGIRRRDERNVSQEGLRLGENCSPPQEI